MERKGRVYGHVLRTVALMLCTGCGMTDGMTEAEVRDGHAQVHISLKGQEYLTRSEAPDEERISDVSILVFDSNGDAEFRQWLHDDGRGGGYPAEGLTVSLASGRTYTLCACVNFGYMVQADTFEELCSMRHHLAYPDEYREGIPMFACMEDVCIREDCMICLEPVRLMAKISLRIDRSRLSEDVDMQVVHARIGNCPKSVQLGGHSRVTDGSGCFDTGFSLDDGQCHPLNTTVYGRTSGEVSLYMLENMQGEFAAHDIEDCEKVLDEDDPRAGTCSYIELGIDYMSDEHYSYGGCLIYRFLLGESAEDLNIERNCHYRITITPEDDGLADSGWRVDKDALLPVGVPGLKGHPASYIRGDIGDTVHIWCEVNPLFAPFDVGLDYLEADRETGIYEYDIDEDGYGATLTLTGPGTGLIYMEAGPPVNDAALFVIEVNQP